MTLDTKEILYRQAYDPMTYEWFSRFEASPLVDRTWQVTEGQGLLPTILAFNSLFHTIVDEQIDNMSSATAHALEVVAEHVDAVIWEGQCEPPENPSAFDIEKSFSYKLKRNISLAYQEGLVVVGSGFNFLQTKPHDIKDAPKILKRSYRLIGGLAVLNDKQETTRLKKLLETDNEISYPQTPFSEIASGNIQISADKFEIVDEAGSESLAFKPIPKQPGLAPATPTMGCPAHRLKLDGVRLNERFWDLLVNIQTLSSQG